MMIIVTKPLLQHLMNLLCCMRIKFDSIKVYQKILNFIAEATNLNDNCNMIKLFSV